MLQEIWEGVKFLYKHRAVKAVLVIVSLAIGIVFGIEGYKAWAKVVIWNGLDPRVTVLEADKKKKDEDRKVLELILKKVDPEAYRAMKRIERYGDR